MSAQVSTPAGSLTLTTSLLGRANLANVLAATAVATEWGVPPADIARRAATLQAAPHRGQLIRLTQGVVLIDDSYNASPAATRRALETLRTAETSGRRLAVLGEMLELGDRSIELHEDIGRLAAASDLGLLVAVGGDAARALAEAAIAAGFPRAQTHHRLTSDAAAGLVAESVRAGDLVLVKGSHGIRTDHVVERLQAEFA
jgi:UDP-N-acetylmuramoyl-tripeptide--D-alanyl-D-alanine ligase